MADSGSPDPKSCTNCNQTFKKRKQYRKHMAISHGIVEAADHISPAIKCEKCADEFSNKILLEDHLINEHSMSGKAARLCIEKMLRNNPSLPQAELLPQTASTSSIPRAPIGQKTSCPICSTFFSRRYSVIDHMRKKHPMPEDELNDQIKNIPTVLTECKKCGLWKTNITTHHKSCKGNLDKHATQQSTEVPIAFLPGGQKIMPMFEDYLKEGDRLSKRTVNQYLHKIVKVGKVWEQEIRNFLLDKLIYPLETQTTLPSLLSYTKAAEDCDAIVAIKAYKHFAAFLKVLFSKYESDNRFSIDTRANWKRYCTEQVEELTKEAKYFAVKVDRKAQDKAADATESGTDLLYNPDKLKRVLKHLLENHEFMVHIESLLDKSEEDLKKEYTEVEIRRALAVYILIKSGGQRPHVITRMKVCELMSASKQDEHFVVRVKDHKTSSKYGPMHLVLSNEDYRAIHKYLQTFYPPTIDQERFVFATRTGNEFEMKHAINWARTFLSGVLTAAELKTLTAKTTRKGSSNWAQQHPNANVNKKAFAVMGHSKTIQIQNYNVVRDKDAIEVNRAVVGDVIMKAGSLKTVTNRGRAGRFSRSEKDLITKALCTRGADGKMMPPSGVNNKTVDQAIGKYPAFANLYKGLVKDKSGIRSKANNVLWTAIRPKPRTAPGPITNPVPSTSRGKMESSSTSESEYESDSDSSSTSESEYESDSDSSSSEFEPKIKARKVNTPGCQESKPESESEDDTD